MPGRELVGQNIRLTECSVDHMRTALDSSQDCGPKQKIVKLLMPANVSFTHVRHQTFDNFWLKLTLSSADSHKVLYSFLISVSSFLLTVKFLVDSLFSCWKFSFSLTFFSTHDSFISSWKFSFLLTVKLLVNSLFSSWQFIF